MAMSPDRPAVELSPSELSKRIVESGGSYGSLLILDLRPTEHYFHGHVKGAVNAPVGPAAMRATTAAIAIAALDDLDAAASRALEHQLPLFEGVVLYDGGAPAGVRAGPAFHLGNLLAADGGPDVAVLTGGYRAFLTQQPQLCVSRQHSEGHRSAAGTIDLIPEGSASALPATVCFEDGRFRLWVGGARDAADRAFVDRHRITHILNTAKELPSRFDGALDHTGEKPLHYLKLGLRDECEEDVGGRLDECLAFLDAARQATLASSSHDGGAALVHCYMGRSRSVIVAAAFLAATRGLSAEAALEIIRAQRPDAWPNDGFRRQLAEWVGARQSRTDSCAGARQCERSSKHASV